MWDIPLDPKLEQSSFQTFKKIVLKYVEQDLEEFLFSIISSWNNF